MAMEITQSGSNFLAKDRMGPVQVSTNLSWGYGHRRHEKNTEIDTKAWIL